MNVRTRGYEGLLEHQEVLESLCGAVLLQAVKDRAKLERRSRRPKDEMPDNVRELDKWFKSRTCREMCAVLGISADFSKIDWGTVRVGNNNKGWRHGS